MPTIVPLGFYDHPVTRSLIQLIPIAGGPLDTLLGAAVAAIRADRLRTFFEELDKGIRELDDATIRSEPLLHAFFSTTRAVEATRQREKIRCFARLLAASTHGAIDYGDDYDEMLGVLTETSHLELQTLARLATLEDEHPHVWLNAGGKESDDARAFRIWPAFLEGFGRWSHDHIRAHLTRLARTGLYEPLYSGGVGDIHVVGRTTESYRGLASTISSAPPDRPALPHFSLSEVMFQDQSTPDYATSPHLRSELRATIDYGGPHSLDGCRLRIGIEYPYDDTLTSEFQEIALSDQQIPILFRSTYHERRFGQDKTCRLRIADLIAPS